MARTDRKGGFIFPGYDPLQVPNPPTNVAATAIPASVVTFTAPTVVGGGAITSYVASATPASGATVSVSATNAYSISGATYDSKSYSIASQETSPGGVFFKSDGTKMYVSGLDSDKTFQYSLSTAWDVSTASYDSVSLDNPGGNVTDIFFKSDGTELYFAESTNQSNVYRYTLSTAWDLSTASSTNSNTSSFSHTGNNQMIFFKTDGTKLYLGNNSNSTTDVFEYNLSTAWDITTSSVSYSSNALETTAQDNETTGCFFNSDGTEFFLIGYQNDAIYKYTLSTAWDISTGSYDSISFSVASQETSPRAITFSSDGLKIYIVGYTNDTVYQYSAGGGAASPLTFSGLVAGTVYTVQVTAFNEFGPSAPSTGVSITPLIIGQSAYTTPGTFSWTAPSGVTSVSVVAVGGGGSGGNYQSSGGNGGRGGAGGGLGYKNNITVTPGASYSLTVGAGGLVNSGLNTDGNAGSNSFFIATSPLATGGGGGAYGSSGSTANGGTPTGDGGGDGGDGGGPGSYSNGSISTGAGGAGGYSGNGGDGSTGTGAGSNGAGGGGGGSGGSYNGTGGGGGVGILGEGSSGAGAAFAPSGALGGGGGSSGVTGATQSSGSGAANNNAAIGGGGGGDSYASTSYAEGGDGAVRIIWPGNTRSFPSTGTGDQ